MNEPKMKVRSIKGGKRNYTTGKQLSFMDVFYGLPRDF